MENTKNIPDSEKHLSDYLLILDRHKWIIIVALVITISATIFFQKMQAPVYQTQASIIIEEPNRVQNMIIPGSLDSPNFDYNLYLDTQIEIIKTTPILSSVVKQLALSSSPEGTQEFLDAVDILRESIKINPVKETKIVKIIVKYNDPEKAQNIANAVAQAYINQDTLSRLQTGQDSARLLSAQLPDLKMKLKNSEDAFQLFKEKEGIIALDTKQIDNLGEMTRLNANYLSVRANRMEIEAIIGNFKPEKLTPNIPVGLLDNPILQKLGSELSQLYTDLEEKRRHFKDTYPGVIELRYRIKLAGQKIIEELNRQRDFLRTQEDSFLEQQKAKKQETVNLSKKEQEYMNLEREVMTNREMYNALLAKAKELSLAEGVDLSNIRVVELAEMPSVPLDRRRKIFALGGAFGLFLGVGLAFLFEYLRNTINTPDDVLLYLGLPVLGFVPRLAIAKHTKTPPIIIQNVNKNLEDMATEAYRTIRTNVLSSILVDSTKTITVTSAVSQEGKSMTAVNLSMVLAQAGYNVLLVDADLRYPKLHQILSVDRRIGLSTVLSHESSLEDAVIYIKAMPNLNVLVSGPFSKTPSEILGSDQMKELINDMREKYDIVLFDSAPILEMTDGAILASETDATIIVIKADETTRKALRIAVTQLKQVGVKILGVVLNNANVKRDKYYFIFRAKRKSAKIKPIKRKRRTLTMK